jgi:hypothetical protein
MHSDTEDGTMPYMETLPSPSHATLASVMPKPSKLAPIPLPQSDETPGQRLAHIRRERSFTQVELAASTGLGQTLVSDYERGQLRLNAGRIFRFAPVLDVPTSALLPPPSGPKPAYRQTTVLKSLDFVLKTVMPAQRQEATR